VISGYRREAAENRTLKGHYTAGSGSFLPTFQDNISVPNSMIKILET